jgi:hypothetical protein
MVSSGLLSFHQRLDVLRGNWDMYHDGFVVLLALLLMPAQVLVAVYLKQRRVE